MSPLSRPLFVVFEGIDGSGKTTQASRLAERLAARGIAVRRLVEPTRGPIGEEIRRRARDGPPLAPREELELFLEDRRANVRENILPALARNEALVQDRSFLSTVAYQGARPELGLSREDLLRLHGEMPKPDVIVLLDLDVDTGLARVASRGKHDAFEERAYLARVLENFRALVGEVGGTVVRRVDAARSPDLVEASVWKIVEPLVVARLLP
ncbi:dTMP kinase [bacterium]|nr:dTMP kinase [bacterium]